MPGEVHTDEITDSPSKYFKVFWTKLSENNDMNKNQKTTENLEANRQCN